MPVQTVLTLNALLAKVAVDLPALASTDNDFYYYLIPEELKNQVKPGTVVRVPFGKQELNGYVINVFEDDTNKFSQSDFKIKPIYEVLYDKPAWDEKYLKLANWISSYYLTSIGTVLSMSVNQDILNSSINELELTNRSITLENLTFEEQFIITKLLNTKKKSLSYRFLFQKSKFNKGKFYKLINQLKNKGLVISKVKYKQKKEPKAKKQEIPSDILSHFVSPASNHKKHVLNKEQEKAFQIILNTINKNASDTFLLHGITGSGKTEVYLHLIEEVLQKNKTVVYLVPEIYLIPQVYERLLSRFNKDEVIIWHSSLGKKERLANWEKLQNNDPKNKNQIKIILGARSTILTPIKDLGLIIIDEAHDASYKQASPIPRYNTIQVAEKRGEIENCPVVLGTATPNITDYYNCLKNGNVLALPNRIKDFKLPSVYIIDLRNESYKNLLSNVLKSTISDALSKKEQVILLLNRRGYSSHLFCRTCGYIKFCRNCSVPMVYHKNQGLVICHHCGYSQGANSEIFLQCPECKSPHFKYAGLGIQQLEEEVKYLFQEAKTLRVDSDELRKKDQYLHLWEEFSSHKADILIGTQLVAKGLDLPNVTVVGVVQADTMLNFPDYVSYERAFQLFTQVTGRAGRGEKPGKVFIQTYNPENPIFNFIQNHDYLNFYKKEVEQRKEYLYPPFTHLSRIIFQSYDENECINYANETIKTLSGQIGECASGQTHWYAPTFLGPAPCFFTKLHGKYRYHILCKFENEEIKNKIFHNLFKTHSKNAKVETIIDVDSVNLL